MHRPLKWRAEQTETGWVQCLSKVLIKPHSKYHWNQTNRSSLKAHRMSMPCNKFALKKNRVWFTSSHHHLKVFLPWLTTSRSFNLAESEQFTQYCKAIYVKFRIPNQAVFFPEWDVHRKEFLCKLYGCGKPTQITTVLCHPAAKMGSQGGPVVKK